MSWPLTGKPLAEFNRLLNDWKQYGTFPFIGPDDIKRLFDVLVASGLSPRLDDVGNRPQYWLLQLVDQVAGSGGGSSGFVTTTPEGLESSIGSFASIYVPGLTGLSFSSETTVQGFNIENQADLITLAFPSLTSLGTAAYIFSHSNASLTSLTFPSLDVIGESGVIEVINNDSLLSLIFPSLTLLGTSSNIFLSTNGSLTSLSFPSLGTLSSGSYISTNDCTLLTDVFLGSAIFEDGFQFYAINDALSQISVDHILARGVASVGFLTGAIDLSGGTSSPPSSIAPGSDYDILINRGVTVTVN